MTTNERIEFELLDIENHTQLSTSQANRVFFTPGKRTETDNQSVRLAENWPTEHIVKTGNPVFDDLNGVIHDRVLKLDRSTICDQTIPSPNVLGTKTTSVTGEGYSSVTIVTETTTQNNNGEQERKTGFENQ